MIDNILYKLGIISHIQQGDKLYCFEDHIYIDNSYVQSISRYIYNQNRNAAISNIQKFIRTTSGAGVSKTIFYSC